MIRAGLPLTVETYVEINWWGAKPDELDVEDEAFLHDLAEYEKGKGP